jgi:hypothetical protein
VSILDDSNENLSTVVVAVIMKNLMPTQVRARVVQVTMAVNPTKGCSANGRRRNGDKSVGKV